MVSVARKLTNEFNMMLNRKVSYKNTNKSWSYIIFLKARELTHYLTGKKDNIDFNKPLYKIERADSDALRQKIIDLSYSEWKEMGFSKGTLHYMKQNVKSGKPFKLNTHVKERFEMWETLKGEA
ncbi:CRISPR-associated protein Cas1 [Methanosalsum natronophilum]|uniref:CRISPR-associated protein Cas1 n=1 Tax=Methanosalsum natronophilum TaxID=768733 RepID=UPI00216715DF|nr:CRISPR-associated protein Cas1 [Methanosalsum natronophilum]MCS3924443.1 hypothetical protein [Methanosalsum natronophilum]